MMNIVLNYIDCAVEMY